MHSFHSLPLSNSEEDIFFPHPVKFLCPESCQRDPLPKHIPPKIQEKLGVFASPNTTKILGEDFPQFHGVCDLNTWRFKDFQADGHCLIEMTKWHPWDWYTVYLIDMEKLVLLGGDGNMGYE